MAIASAPSSPTASREWGGLFFTSAPSSPSRLAAVLHDVPADQSPPPDSPVDFAFAFPGGSSPLTAAELFDHGVIRPLKPPPRLQSLNSPLSPKHLSPRRRSMARSTAPSFDPFAAAVIEVTRGRSRESPDRRGRTTRSLSPLRRIFHVPDKTAAPAKKWRLKDLFLFRSASEGRAYGGDRDPVGKYTAATSSRKGGAAAAHVRHYEASRAAAEERRRRTSLPYKPHVFGLLSFRGFSSLLGRHE